MARAAMLFTVIVAGTILASPTLAQLPSGQGQMPGTLAPAPAVIAPPRPVAPAQVPSVVTPLPSPSYGVPRNINSGPVLGSGTPTFRYTQPRKRYKRRPPRTSDLLLIRQF